MTSRYATRQGLSRARFGFPAGGSKRAPPWSRPRRRKSTCVSAVSTCGPRVGGPVTRRHTCVDVLVPAQKPQVDTRASHLTGGRHASRRFPLSAAATAILLEAGPRRRILLVRRGPGFEGTLSKAPLINQPCQFRGHSSIPPRHPRRDTRATRVSFVPPSRRMLG